MGRDDRSLPEEYRGGLDYQGLISKLESLCGEVVCVPFVIGTESRSRLEVLGVLRRVERERPNVVFAIGDSAKLALVEGDFENATLRTLEGSFYFVIKIQLRGGSIEIGDEELLGTDLWDRSWDS